jgi:4-amino-4-deoxy-L-arabinose transferase-like glycosyltransferase
VLWWSLGVLLALGVHDDLPDDVAGAERTIRMRLAWLGVVVGVAFASRFINGLLGPACVVIVVVRAHAAWWRKTLRDAIWILPCVAALTLYAVWPRLWDNPFAALSDSFAKLNHPHGDEPFLGAITTRPGPHYFIVYLAATVPIGVAAGAIAWAVRTVRKRDRRAWVVLAWLVVPLGVAASPIRQDGVRYILPALSAVALASAAGWDAIAGWLEPRWRHAFVAVSGAVIAYLVVVLVWIHPYYLDYFAEQVGGPGTVAEQRWFETAWWGEGVDRAVAYVNDHAREGAHVLNCVAPNHLTWYRQDLWTPGPPDWIVVYAPSTNGCAIPPDARRVFSVDAGGAVLAEVWTREP